MIGEQIFYINVFLCSNEFLINYTNDTQYYFINKRVVYSTFFFFFGYYGFVSYIFYCLSNESAY
jgi:hypothetical protein